MSLMLAIFPAILWGIGPLIIHRIGGTSLHQLTGTSIGIFLVAIIAYLLRIHTFTITFTGGFFGFISGSAWVVGQYGQYNSYSKMGISRVMPFSTAVQLIGTGLIGGLFLNEWSSPISRIIGAVSITLLILGAIIISINKQEDSKFDLSAVYFLMFTSTGYWIYSCVPKLVKTDGVALFITQALGILVTGLIFSFFVNHSIKIKKNALENIFPGILYGIAAIAYIFAAQKNGVTVAYLIGQLNIVISTVGGMILFREYASTHELLKKVFGLILIVIGSLLTILI